METAVKFNKYNRTLTICPKPTQHIMALLEVWSDYDPGTGNSTEPPPPFKSTYKDDPTDEPIDLSKYYLGNELLIFNRWGEKVYEVDNYENNWDGGGHRDGTYFYVIKCNGQYRTDVFKGSFMILGSGDTE